VYNMLMFALAILLASTFLEETSETLGKKALRAGLKPWPTWPS